MNKRCRGCGSLFQFTDPLQAGYIKEEVLIKHKSAARCERCFNLQNYNTDISKIKKGLTLKDLETIKLDKKDGIIIVIDLFNLDLNLINSYSDFFKNKNVVIVLNKLDLFPKHIKKDYLINYVKKNLEFKVTDVFCLSTKFDRDIQSLLLFFNRNYKHSKLLFLGITNSGKSTLINELYLAQFNHRLNLTISSLSNTTLDFLEIDFGDFKIIDTFGFYNEKSFYGYLDKESLLKITPKKVIKPKIYPLNPKQVIFIDGFLEVRFIEGEMSSFVFHGASNLYIHRTKLDNADDFYIKHVDDLLKYPNKTEREKLGNRVSVILEVSKEEPIEIFVSGLGFIKIVGEMKVEVITFENINIYTREVLI